MAAGNSDDVTIFLVLFAQLKDWIDDDPLLIETTALEDIGFRDVCENVYWAGFSLESREKEDRQLFANPVDVKFVQSWREYQDHYIEKINNVVFNTEDLFKGLDLGIIQESRVISRAEIAWEIANDTATQLIECIRTFFSFKQEYIYDENHELPDAYRKELLDGLNALLDLRNKLGIDFRGVFRRRELVPFVLIPRHVSPAYNTEKQDLLIDYLQQAQEAFVKGVPRASIALLRSTAEAVLRWYYQSFGNNLEEVINNAKFLPAGASQVSLHRLRTFANEILHVDQKEGSRVGSLKLQPLSDVKQELELASLLRIVRDLIESAPTHIVNAKRRY